MERFFAFSKKRLNSWSEISLNETLRLRSNILMFTFIVSCLCIVTAALIIIDYGIVPALPTIALVLISAGLFFRQLFKPAYSVSTAWVFAGLGFSMATFLIWTGGVEGTGALWLYTLPIIATMALPLRGTLIYDGILMSIILALLFSPLRDFMSYDYSASLCISVPLSVMFVIICSYMTEHVRHRTHEELVVTSKKLQTSALTDHLTQIYNRRALELHFGDMNRKPSGLAFAMLDLDYFKKVNDNYGHDVGDKVLGHVVKLTRENMPANAGLYRWGGEEFLLVLKTDNPDEFAKELDHLREKIEENPLVFDEGLHATIKITVSIGGTHPGHDLTMGERIRRADVHLYEAKEKGRNRVVVR